MLAQSRRSREVASDSLVIIEEFEGCVRLTCGSATMTLTTQEARKRAATLARFADIATQMFYTVDPRDSGLLGPIISEDAVEVVAYRMASEIFAMACHIDMQYGEQVSLVPEDPGEADMAITVGD